MNWRRFDTLGLRLFVLMWLVLVTSHLVAYLLAPPLFAPGGPGLAERLNPGRLPTLTSLPPGGPLDRGPPRGAPGQPGGSLPPAPPPGGGPALPARVLWADYGLRLAITALGAALAARWLARPMRQLAAASRALSANLSRGRPPALLDAGSGSAEVRETASVFNAMARRLQEQFDARGLQLAAVSHDLRTPLTRLRMRLEGAPPALAAAAQADIREMAGMIDSTLDVLREQQGAIAPSVVDLGTLVEALIDDLAEAGHDVAWAVPRPPATQVLAHPAALKRIAGNLLGNALRYGGSARLTLERGAGGWQLQVADQGPGIPADQLEQVFRPWVQLAGGHPRAGHGLGLAIARELAGRDGGSVTLANRPGGGLCATLQLPAANVSASTPNS